MFSIIIYLFVFIWMLCEVLHHINTPWTPNALYEWVKSKAIDLNSNEHKFMSEIEELNRDEVVSESEIKITIFVVFTIFRILSISALVFFGDKLIHCFI